MIYEQQKPKTDELTPQQQRAEAERLANRAALKALLDKPERPQFVRMFNERGDKFEVDRHNAEALQAAGWTLNDPKTLAQNQFETIESISAKLDLLISAKEAKAATKEAA